MNKYILILSCIYLVGCNSPVPLSVKKPEHVKSKSISDFIVKYREGSNQKWLDMYNLNQEVWTHDGLKEFKRTWCLDNNSSVAELKNLVAEHCSILNGKVVNNWCVSASNKPLYWVYIAESAGGSVNNSCIQSEKYLNKTPIVVNSIENSNLSNELWEDYSRNHGFKTEQEYQAYKINEAKEKEKSNIIAAAKKVSDLENKKREEEIQKKKVEQESNYIKSHVGTRICRRSLSLSKNENIIEVGFVDAIAGEKVRISISDAFIENGAYKGTVPGGFSPKIVWDYPSNWYICE